MFIVQDFRKSLSIVTPYFVFPVFLRYGSATRHFAQLSDLTQKISFCLILFSAGWKNFEISLILWLLSRDPGGYVCWSVQIWYLKFLDFFVWKLFLSWTRIFFTIFSLSQNICPTSTGAQLSLLFTHKNENFSKVSFILWKIDY